MMQVIEVLAVIRDVPEAHMERRPTLIIAFVQQTMYRHGKKLCNFLLMWKGFLREVFWHEKRAS